MQSSTACAPLLHCGSVSAIREAARAAATGICLSMNPSIDLVVLPVSGLSHAECCGKFGSQCVATLTIPRRNESDHSRTLLLQCLVLAQSLNERKYRRCSRCLPRKRSPAEAGPGEATSDVLRDCARQRLEFETSSGATRRPV